MYSGTDTRAVSTVFDVTLFLLIVSVAIGVLVYLPVDGGQTPDAATETASTLATSTESVTYTPAPPGTTATLDERTEYGTVAQLLATATVATAEVDGEPLAPTPAYTQAVRNATKNVLPALGEAARIRATWEPAGTQVRGELTVGPRPPPTAETAAASITVPVSAPVTAPEQDTADRAGRARMIIAAMFPPQQAKTALESTDDEAAIVTARYRAAGSTLGTDVKPALEATDPTSANAMLARALATQLGSDAGSTGTATTDVTLTVRTWSP